MTKKKAITQMQILMIKILDKEIINQIINQKKFKRKKVIMQKKKKKKQRKSRINMEIISIMYLKEEIKMEWKFKEFLQILMKEKKE